MRALSLPTGFLLALLACSSREVIGSSYRPGEQPQGGSAGGPPASAGAGPAAGTSSAAGGSGSPSSGATFDEPYRGQFHFSVPSMWLGAINALWFDAGVYHLAFQHNPFVFEQGVEGEHWGRATSTDLLRWQHQPLMLSHGLNAPGDPWVGSVVVDTANTAGFQTGDQPAYVAIFTATGVGTSLAYSTDLGQTWQAYAQNPVAIGDADHEQNRDPLVLWHAPTAQWVCAYWQNGITFYTSPDLKTWTERASLAWGGIVPDLYELPVDGRAEERLWVLQHASGEYVLGDFDGQAFAQSAGPFLMDHGPSFYAARTSYRATFPDQRAVQIAWLRSDVASAPARGSATFPVELGLKTFPEGVRLTRTPIAELAQLYGSSRHFDAQLLAKEQNLLAGMRAKAFELEFEVDATQQLPNEIRVHIAGQLVLYDTIDQTLQGQHLATLDGRLKLRFLVDHGQLEIFANDGQLSYSESVAFPVDDDSVSLSGDGPLPLLSADFRELERIWPGEPALASQVIDDVAPEVSYFGAWDALTGDATYVGDTCHVSTSPDAALELSFTGTSVVWYGLTNTDLGLVDLYLDGALVADDVDCYAATRAPERLFGRSGLADTFHTLRIEATGQKNAASTGTALVHDYFIVATER